MKPLSTTVGLALAVFGLVAFGWPFPMFTLNEPWLSGYMAWVNWAWGIPDAKVSPSAGAALPFVWMFFSLPVGIIAIGVSVPLIHYGRSK